MAKPIQYCEVISLQLNKFKLKKQRVGGQQPQWQATSVDDKMKRKGGGNVGGGE